MKSGGFTLGVFNGCSCCLHDADWEGKEHFLQSKQTASSSKLGNEIGRGCGGACIKQWLC